MKRFKHWKRYSLLCASTILLTSASLVIYEIYRDYQSIQILQIDTFDSYWKKVFDEESKTIKQIDDRQLSELKGLIETPSDKSRYKFLEVSVNLGRTIDNSRSYEIDQILSFMSDYQLDPDVDKDFPEQRSKNLEILKSLEKFTTDLSSSIQSLTISDDRKQIIFDANVTEHEDLSKIETSVRWSQIDKYNSMIETLNSEIKSQIAENEDYRKQKTIIDLKQNLDEFIALIESTKEKLKSKYVSAKIVKTLVDRISSIKPENNDWLSDSLILEYRGVNEDRTSSLSEKFFLDNGLDALKSLSNEIVVKSHIKSERINVRDKNDESRSSKITVKSSVDLSNLTDQDLIEIDSIKNLVFEMTIDQTEKVFKDISTSSSSSTASSDIDTRARRSNDRISNRGR